MKTQSDGISVTTTTDTPTLAPSAPATVPERTGTVIVGAGQTGLATAYYLKKAGLDVLVLDENAAVGDQWRRRYDSLRLYSPSQYDGLPGMKFPASKQTFPTGHQMADFLQAYVETFELPVRNDVKVTKIERTDAAQYLVTCGDSQLLADQVVVATGGETFPRTPDFAPQLDPAIRQMHSSEYHNPSQLLPGPVLVVGASHSGTDLALELAHAGHDVTLSGRSTGRNPLYGEGPAGRVGFALFWFAANHVITTKTPMGRKMQPKVRAGGAPLLRVQPSDLAAAGVRWSHQRTTGVSEDGKPVLADGTVLDVANVLWCTGYRQDFSMIDLPVVGDDGWPLDEGGVVPSAPGLYFMGLLFQRGMYSMLVGGAGRDATFIASHIIDRVKA